MLYTNRGLEIIEKDNKRHLEVLNIYDKNITIPIDEKVSDKLIMVQGKFHKFLSLEENEDGTLKLVSRKDGNLYLILDLLDYKCFQRNSVLLKLKGDTGFDTLRYFRTNNRCNKCTWGLHILKAPKREFSILKIFTTSGTEKYLTIYKGFIMLHSIESLKSYVERFNINFNVDESEWELLKRK